MGGRLWRPADGVSSSAGYYLRTVYGRTTMSVVWQPPRLPGRTRRWVRLGINCCRQQQVRFGTPAGEECLEDMKTIRRHDLVQGSPSTICASWREGDFKASHLPVGGGPRRARQGVGPDVGLGLRNHATGWMCVVMVICFRSCYPRVLSVYKNMRPPKQSHRQKNKWHDPKVTRLSNAFDFESV